MLQNFVEAVHDLDAAVVQPIGHFIGANTFLVGLTAAVIGLNIVLWAIAWKVINGRLRDLNTAIVLARRTSEAANLTAHVLTRRDRPYLAPARPELQNWAHAVRTEDESSTVEIYLDVTNIGQNVGFVDSFSLVHEICPHGQQGSQPLPLQLAVGRMPVGVGAKWQPNQTLDSFQLSPQDKLKILHFEASLFIYGHIRYFDLAGSYWRSGFMFEFVPAHGRPQQSSFAVCHHAMWYDVDETNEPLPYAPAVAVQGPPASAMLEE